MQPTDVVRFAEAMGMLGEVFNEPVSDVRVEGYFAALVDLDAKAVLASMRHAMGACQFFPKPAELRKFVVGDPSERSDGAWGEMLREVRRVGYMGVPTLSDPQTSLAIRDVWGSWHRLCETLPADGPELVGWMKQFKGAYQSVERRNEQAQIASGVPPQVKAALAAIASQKVLR